MTVKEKGLWLLNIKDVYIIIVRLIIVLYISLWIIYEYKCDILMITNIWVWIWERIFDKDLSML